MAKESVNILKDKIDIVDLLAQLNAALSEEWLAFYQYWVGSFVVEGAMRGDVQREFQEHAAEEYNHAKLLADRIIELEGVPVLDPKQWFDLARCKYDAPVDFGSEILLKQNVESERCASPTLHGSESVVRTCRHHHRHLPSGGQQGFRIVLPIHRPRLVHASNSTLC